MASLVVPARRVRRLLLGVGITAALLLGAVAGTGFALSERLGNNIERIPAVFDSLEETTRPPVTDAQTFLLVGTDSRTATSDAIMIAQISPDRSNVTTISLPTNGWIEIPGRGPGTISSAYAVLEPAVLIEAVEALTAWRIDHFALVDFARFDGVVDSVGGISVPGTGDLDGPASVAYLQRNGAPDGDLDSALRQEEVMRAVLSKVISSGTLRSPTGMFDMLDAASRSVSLDDSLTNGGLRSLAFDMRDMRPADFTLLKAPVGGSGTEAGQPVVYLDGTRSAVLWEALRTGTTVDYAADHPGDLSGAVSN